MATIPRKRHGSFCAMVGLAGRLALASPHTIASHALRSKVNSRLGPKKIKQINILFLTSLYGRKKEHKNVARRR